MKKHFKIGILTACILFCILGIFGCGKEQTSDEINNSDASKKQLEESILDEQEKTEAAELDKAQTDETQDESDIVSEQNDAQEEDSETYFYEKAKEQGIERKEAEEYWERLLTDNIFQDDSMELTGLVIEDMDGNGQKDLMVMLLDSEVKKLPYVSYGFGCVWLYMNEDEPYCFEEEDACYYGLFELFAEDIDNDGSVEIVLSMQGSGVGTADYYKAIFKYKNHNIERMELPSDFAEDYSDIGIHISVYQETAKNRYSAYCDYLNEKIYFDAENAHEPGEEAVCAGANARGFYDLRPVKYKGKNALQASEYLYGEGGAWHSVASAKFIILWDENGNAYIDKWWIHEEETYYANLQGNRITYEDGYYYYASQLDNYFLYRVKEDGSEPVCLAKVHPGTIFVDEDVIYFVNLSDSKAIYRIGTDGSDMQKICDNSYNNIQMSAEYIYFLDTYEREADIRRLVAEAEAEELSSWDDEFLYRIRKDGSGKELILTDAKNYMINTENGGKVMYDGYIYCGRYRWSEESDKWITAVTRYDLDGENEEAVCCFDFRGDILVFGSDRIYCYSNTYYLEDEGKIGLYTTWKKEMKYLPNMKLTDYCIYKGTLYGVREDENNRSTKVYSLEYYGETQWEEIYCNDTDCVVSRGYVATDIYATEQGIFFRQFVSPEEGVKWFSLGEGENVEKWENEKEIPIIIQASRMEYTGEYISIKPEFKSTNGYEEYLGEDLTYEEFYRKDGTDIYTSGKDYNPYTIRLPQFNEKIEGYRKINAYFQNVYQEALGYKEEFFDMLDEESKKEEEGFPNPNLYEGIGYDYVYIGEKYITVAKYRYGYWGGKRGWNAEEPVTFERKTGRVVSLEEFFGNSQEEAVAIATASIYKYMESGEGYGAKYFLKNEDVLTERFIPEQFFLFPEGIGLYYRRYAIDCGAAGDYVFIVPYLE